MAVTFRVWDSVVTGAVIAVGVLAGVGAGVGPIGRAKAGAWVGVTGPGAGLDAFTGVDVGSSVIPAGEVGICVRVARSPGSSTRPKASSTPPRGMRTRRGPALNSL